MSNHNSLYRTLIRSHLTIAALGFIVLCAALAAIWQLGSSAGRLANDIGPAAQASLRIVSGIQASTAALNGWVAVGDTHFKTERSEAWRNTVYPAVTNLQKYLKNNIGTVSAKELKELKELFIMLKDLQEAQWWLEEVAQSPSNNQAKHYYQQNIAHSLHDIQHAVIGVIQLSSTRNNLVLSNTVKDFRHQLNLSTSALRHFIDNGEHRYKKEFINHLRSAQQVLDDLKQTSNKASNDQQQQMSIIGTEFAALDKFGVEAVRLRESNDWNIAQFQLDTEIVPLTRLLLEKFEAIAAQYSTAMQKQATEVQQVTLTSLYVITILVALLATLAVWFALRTAKQTTAPIAILSKAADSLASGKLKNDITVTGTNEFTALAAAFNQMRQAIEDKTNALEKHQHELEEQVAQRTEELAISRDLAEKTLLSIGDAVISTDCDENITMMNPIAEQLTGWASKEAVGQKITTIFKVVNEQTKEPVECPLARCIKTNRIVLLENDSNLICRDGSQIAVDDSAAPIHDAKANVIGAILVFRNVTNERQLQQKLTHQATHDTLTGLVNRYEFELRMESALMFARNEQRTHAVAFLDLDQFKVVNDTCGHAAGDELLKQLTRLIGEPIRQHDTLARIGGDEFAILLENCDMDNAFKVCETIRQDIKDFRFRWDDHAFEVGVSIGLTHVNEHSDSIATILSNADAACYEAKEAGRNCVKISDRNDSEGTEKEVQWASRITEAMDEGRMVLYIQPIVSISSGTEHSKHCEVLVRMVDREGAIVPPGAFLPAAERYNLIQSVDCYVVKKACEAYKNGLFGPVTTKQIISINLSGQSIGSDKVLNCIKHSLETYAVPANVICFEITETAAMNNMLEALAFINELKAIGCSFALDDFGSGLSSYGYLQNMPVDYVKIDGRFVKDIINNPIDSAMVASINEISHLMGKKTIAEFVENTEIGDKLREMGVDYVQGWGFGKPVAIADHLTAIAKPESISS